jgi:hypothetical protein
MYGIYLNPKNCFFGITEGNILGHLVSKEGIYIDPKRVNEINYLNHPTSRKGVQ